MYFKKDKIFNFNDRNYSYEELHELKYRYCLDDYQYGNVTNLETGEIKDLSNLKDFYTSALSIISKDIKESEYGIPNKDINYMINYLNSSQHKEFIKKVEENPTEVSDEDVIQYWKIKNKTESESGIEFVWNMKSFIKHNPNFNIKSFSTIDKGRIMNMIELVTYKDVCIIERTQLMKLLEFANKEVMRSFLKRLEDNEIIYRVDKNCKTNVNIIFNPFFLLKGVSKKITYDIYKMFPSSTEMYISKLGVRYLEIENNNMATMTVSGDDSIEYSNL